MSQSVAKISNKSYVVEQLDASFWSQQPEKIRSKISLVDGVLHISNEIRGDLDMIELVATLRRKGVLSYKFHDPKEFAENYAKYIVRCITNQNEIERLLIDILARAYKEKASDIHITDNGEYIRIRFRILGMLCEDTALDVETGRQLIRSTYEHIGSSTDGQTFTKTERLDGRITKRAYLPDAVNSVRMHCEPIECAQADEGTGTFMALRLLYDSTSAGGTLEERMKSLGFLESQIAAMRFLTQRTGLIVISGATGHGKSTLLKHVMEAMCEESPHLAFHTVEDPPEFPLKNVHQIKIQTKDASNRLKAYIDAMGGAWRSDPDVLMFGEIRYEEAAKSAIQIARSGHPTWTTLHANNAFGIVDRLAGMLTVANPLASICDPNVLAGLEYQRLIPKLCPHCKRVYGQLSQEEKKNAITETVMDALSYVLEYDEIEKICVRGNDLCEHCHSRGFVGQTVAAEVVSLDLEMLSLLRVGKTFDAYFLWRSKGGISYLDHAIVLVKSGIVDPVYATSRLGVPLNFNKFFETARDRQ
jgi:type II secretory ATPase GspE/PulE/Tfp pilus assembly ATPase PilB-like protein